MPRLRRDRRRASAAGIAYICLMWLCDDAAGECDSQSNICATADLSAELCYDPMNSLSSVSVFGPELVRGHCRVSCGLTQVRAWHWLLRH
jgi:hypothetical protein